MGSSKSRTLWDGTHRLRLKGQVSPVRRAGTETGGDDDNGFTRDFAIDGTSVATAVLDFIYEKASLDGTKHVRVEVLVKPLKRIRKTSDRKRFNNKEITVDDILDTWYADVDPSLANCCFIKHIMLKNRLYQLVAGFDPKTDGLYRVIDMHLRRGEDGVIYLALKDCDPITIKDCVQMRRKLIGSGMVTSEEFTRYFGCSMKEKKLMIMDHPLIKITSS